ncbi:predicted protein [Ostreococcus lucimarinus CCE9901]|uniref:Uncharacterized protein n=1 Tax=Ostreococcus lucimarinus (strain CCE9901) TaxID=436017 RepID=A4S7U7_OSTLU|nr:predicted protein [Ostreococcus lucimarinus CCE9901]ABO99629.1 predicted protein [Ostreococcus lucimarinus CCE9901]|eukprot:XP_001421336.1 predicted protein [Ostreococcus lucimarinus CCE9901]
MVYGAVPVKDEENPLLGVRSSSKRPRSFAYGVIAVVCVAALAISGVSRATDESSREDHLSALGDLSNDYLAKRSWWQDVKTANETLITAKQASDKAMEAAAEAEEKFDELKLDAEEKDRMCTDIHKAEDQTSGCDDHCSTGAVQASRLGWGSWSVSSWSWSVSSWWQSIRQRAAEAAKKAAEAKKAKCMETCKSLDCGLPKCKNAPAHRTCPPAYSGDRCKTGFDLYADKPYRNIGWRVGITGVDESRKYFKCLGTYCNPPIGAEYYFPDKRTNKCTERVVMERKDTWGRLKSYHTVGVGSDYLSECGKCTD